MPLRILLSTSTRTLLSHLAATLALPGPAEQVRPVLLPSRPLVERVRYALAGRAGVAMGVEFVLPAAFLARLSEAVALEPLDPAWTPDGLFWRILPLIEGLQSHERLRAACADPRARLALARQVADRFDQYLHFRPEMIRAWDSNRPWPELPASARRDEEWQRWIWDGLKRAAPDAPHPVLRLEKLKARAAAAPGDLLGPAVEVLSTGRLPQSLLEVLGALGRSPNRVILRQLLPSVEYLADVETRKAVRLRGGDPDPDYEVPDLLARLGRQAIETFRGLERLDEGGQAFEFLEPADGPSNGSQRPTLLGALQADLRSAAPPAPGRELCEGPENLRSIRVHRCHGPRREVEVLRDEVLAALEEDPGLRPEDILILAPDLEVYGPLCRAILGRGRPALPLRLAERRLESRDAAFQAAKAFLAFAAGRATLSEGRELLELPAVAARLGGEARDALLASLEASGITFGLDPAHRADLGAGEASSGTWRSGVDRLLAGFWLGDEDGAVDTSGSPVLPAADAAAMGFRGLIAGLVWLDTVVERLRPWRRPATPSAWAGRLGGVRDLLDPAGAGDETALEELLEVLEAAEARHGCALELDAAQLLDWLEWQDLDEARTVRPVGGAVGLGGFKPLRALPCKVLAVLGLDDASFPRRSERLAWDLMAAQRRSGDRDAHLEDSQLFLDALLAAEGRVILTAPGRNPRTDKDEPLSETVDELVRALLAIPGPGRRGEWERALVRAHPLQPFDERAFSGDEPGFDAAHLEIAGALRAERKARLFTGERGLPPRPSDGIPGPVILEWEGFLRDLKDPAAAWLRRLGLRPPREARDPSEGDDEPADLDDGLLRWMLRRDALERAESGPRPFGVERLQADRLLPLGRLGRDSAAVHWGPAEAAARTFLGNPGALGLLRLEAQVGGAVFRAVARRLGKGGALALLNPGRLDSPKLELEAFALAALAEAAGQPLALRLLVWDHDRHAMVPREYQPLMEGKGRAWLAAALDALQGTRADPPCFAPKTSRKLAGAIRGADRGRPFDAERAFEGAREEWLGGYADWEAEGTGDSARLAWRGRDPFAAELRRRWLEVAEALWKPVLEWEEAGSAAGKGGA